MFDGTVPPGDGDRAVQDHWHVGANYPNEKCLGQIGCVPTFGDAVDILAPDLMASDLLPGDIAAVHDVRAYIEQIRSWETHIAVARGFAFLAGGLIFWVCTLPSSRSGCVLAHETSPSAERPGDSTIKRSGNQTTHTITADSPDRG